jgi:polyisoprenoid-binding protein YceI
MSITVGKHVVGPDNGKLLVRTKKGGAASMAGHNLLIEVTDWSATLEVGEDGAARALELTADSASLRVREGSGGVQSLDEGDKSNINQTINDEVLKGGAIAFRSTSVQGDETLHVEGELELAGKRHPIAFELGVSGGRVTGAAAIKQTDWGMKPYSALFGTLKVLDEVQVEIDAELPAG